MFFKNTRFNWQELAIIILPLILVNKFFNYRYVVEWTSYSVFLFIFLLGLLVFTSRTMLQATDNKSISISVKQIIFIFLASVLVSFISRDQNVYESLRGMAPYLTICFYFLLIKNKVSSRSVVQAFIILLILYAFFFVIAYMTFPDNVFGYSASLLDRSSSDIERRGTFRLLIPGADFVILCIFYVLNQSQRNKKYGLWLIPLFILLIFRGTRMPLFVVIIMSLLYFFKSYKRKYIVYLVAILLYFFIPIIYNTILESHSDNIVVKYVQFTENQINSEDDDVRIRMSEYYLYDFNKTPQQVIFGNGAPFYSSSYGKEISKLCDIYHYFMEDVGYIRIYVQFGLIGLIMYLFLLIKILRTPVEEEYMFAKLFAIYYFIVSITGSYILDNSIILVFGLYLIEKHRKNSTIKLNNNSYR